MLTYDSEVARPPTKEEESTEHLNHWREFRPHPILHYQSPNTWEKQFNFKIYKKPFWVSNNHSSHQHYFKYIADQGNDL